MFGQFTKRAKCALLSPALSLLRDEVRREATRASHDALSDVQAAIGNDRQISDPADAPILVYQFGKVASTTVASTIAELAPQCEVNHVHGLTTEFWERLFAYGNGNQDGKPFLDACHRLQNEAAQLRLRIEATRGVPFASRGWKWRIVTITREPVAQTLSGLFHLAEYVIRSLGKKGGNHSRAVERVRRALMGQIEGYGDGSLAEPTDFLERACRASFNHIDEWFDYELNEVFGSDVYEQPFDFSRGYSVIRNDFADVLVLRFEGLFENLDEALEAFLNVPVADARASRKERNRTDSKAYGDTYREFLRNLELPPAFLDARYDSKYVKHFYSAKELDGFKKRWGSPESMAD
jgi:hypothetical protein